MDVLVLHPAPAAPSFPRARCCHPLWHSQSWPGSCQPPPEFGRSCWFLNFFTLVVIHEALLDLGTELGLGVSPPLSFPVP